MKILGIDCTASPASTAVLEDGKLISYSYTNVGLTHSQTLMPMLAGTLSNAKISLSDIDVFAIDAGPGSFTGVRIGVAALKGLTLFDGDSCIAVSSLESMAYNYCGVKDVTVCSVMDARCRQVYTAGFDVTGGGVRRLTEDRAIMLEELTPFLKSCEGDVVFVGDGAPLCYNYFREKIDNCSLAPEQLRYQNAVSTAACAKVKLDNGAKPVSSESILPVYLRAPQAERELKRKTEASHDCNRK